MCCVYMCVCVHGTYVHICIITDMNNLDVTLWFGLLAVSSYILTDILFSIQYERYLWRKNVFIFNILIYIDVLDHALGKCRNEKT